MGSLSQDLVGIIFHPIEARAGRREHLMGAVSSDLTHLVVSQSDEGVHAFEVVRGADGLFGLGEKSRG